MWMGPNKTEKLTNLQYNFFYFVNVLERLHHHRKFIFLNDYTLGFGLPRVSAELLVCHDGAVVLTQTITTVIIMVIIIIVLNVLLHFCSVHAARTMRFRQRSKTNAVPRKCV